MARLQIGTASASSQADLVNDLGNKGYLVFGLILFVWELLPTTLLVGFFRVHRPPQDLVRASGEGRHWRSLGWVLGVWEASVCAGSCFLGSLCRH